MKIKIFLKDTKKIKLVVLATKIYFQSLQNEFNLFHLHVFILLFLEQNLQRLITYEEIGKQNTV